MANRNLKLQESIKSLKKRMRLKAHSQIRDRIRVIVLAQKGFTDPKIAKQVGFSVPWVKKWIRRYKDGGFEGLQDQLRPGAPLKLTEDQVINLYQKIFTGPEDDEFLSRYRISDLQDFIRKDWGVKYSISGLHSVMKRMKLSHVKPRPEHPKNDPLVMAAWKKKPKLSLKKKFQSAKKKKFRFGSKTKPGSVKRVS